jgi:hypothetical protein
MAGGSSAVTVESLRLRLLLVGPLRLVLAAGLLLAARAASLSGGPTLLAFAAGAFVIVFLASNDPRARFRRGSGEAVQLPADARVAPPWQHVVHAAVPSTVGVTILAAAAVAFEPTLTALCAGILAGLGIAALAAARGTDRRLYLDPRRRVVFRK